MDSENQTNPRSSIEYWRGLAQIAREEELAELEVERDGVRIRLSAASAVTAASAPPPAPTVAVPGAALLTAPAPTGAAPTGTAIAAAGEEGLVPIISPMVGMFYRAPSPSDPNFVEIGDKVEVGQTVALVEAMKVFNEITSEVAGVVAEIKAQNGDLVETGQVLITIRP